jgi:hypothetical protein
VGYSGLIGVYCLGSNANFFLRVRHVVSLLCEFLLARMRAENSHLLGGLGRVGTPVKPQITV